MSKTKRFEVHTEREAIMAISAGVTFFAIKKPIKTVLVLLLMGFGPAYVAFDYFTSYRATIKEAEPIAKPTAFHVVQQRTDEIVIGGNLYGYFDARYECWKVKDLPVILMHDKKTGEVLKVEIKELTRRK